MFCAATQIKNGPLNTDQMNNMQHHDNAAMQFRPSMTNGASTNIPNSQHPVGQTHYSNDFPPCHGNNQQLRNDYPQCYGNYQQQQFSQYHGNNQQQQSYSLKQQRGGVNDYIIGPENHHPNKPSTLHSGNIQVHQHGQNHHPNGNIPVHQHGDENNQNLIGPENHHPNKPSMSHSGNIQFHQHGENQHPDKPSNVNLGNIPAHNHHPNVVHSGNIPVHQQHIPAENHDLNKLSKSHSFKTNASNVVAGQSVNASTENAQV